ncbi:uncharacterized protein [Hetaerina americana]|uniref:uncharacterized protein isoform X2 n=1 Tax=Hetaerina americana TaxID=62018 RepID=UPI003A7F3E07
MKTRMKSTEWFAHPAGESSDVGSPKRKSKIMDEHMESHNRLHMLAAVASHHLHSDPTMKMSPGNSLPKLESSMHFVDIHSPADNGHLLSSKRKRASCRKLGEGDMLSLDQIRELSAHHLLKCFSDFDGNELKRTFTYSCVLDPARCQKKFSSFGSELKARQQMKSHLLEHVNKLSEEAMMGLHFKAETVQSRQRRKVDSANLLSKKKKTMLRAMGQPLKTSCNVKDDSKPKGGNASSSRVLCVDPVTRDMKSETKLGQGGTSRLAGILREHPTKVDKGSVKQEGTPVATTVMDTSPIKVEGGGGAREVVVKTEDPVALMDHNYFLQGTDSTSGDDVKGQGILAGKPQEWHCDRNESLLKSAIKTGLEEKSKHTSPELNKFMMSETLHNVIMVCVLEKEKLQLKQLPCVGSEMDVKTGQLKDFLKKMAESESEEDSREIKVINNNNNIERDEYRMKKKPKGKAKFIGQSKAEKEKAIQMIEAIKGRVTSLESLECQICIPPRSFTAPTTLISHYRSHAGIKPYECRLCRSVFTRQHSLNYHMLIHSNQTRFTCSDCGRKFRHPSHFKEHRRRHTGESPYECSDCMYRFKTRNTYKRHMRTHHGKMLTPSGELLVLSDDEFKQVRALPRHVSSKTTARILSKSRNSDCTRSNAMQGGERSNGEDDEMEYISQESDISSDVNSDSNSPDELCGEERGSNKENNNMEVDGTSGVRAPLEGKVTSVRKAFFKDIVKEAMRQSDIPFQGSDFRSCEGDAIIPDPIEFSVTEVVGDCDSSYYDDVPARSEDADQVTKAEGMDSGEKGMRPIVVKSEMLEERSRDQLNCIYLNTDQCVALDNQNVETMCSTSYGNAANGGTSKVEGIDGASNIEKGKSTMLLFKPMVVNQGSQGGLGVGAQPENQMASTSGSFVSHPSMSILACQSVNGLLGEGGPKERPSGHPKKIYIQAEGTLIGALKSQTLMLLNEDAGTHISYCPIGGSGGTLKNGMFAEGAATHL